MQQFSRADNFHTQMFRMLKALSLIESAFCSQAKTSRYKFFQIQYIIPLPFADSCGYLITAKAALPIGALQSNESDHKSGLKSPTQQPHEAQKIYFINDYQLVNILFAPNKTPTNLPTVSSTNN